MSLADVTNWTKNNGKLLFASYNSATKQLAYEPPRRIVFNPPCKQSLVDFTACEGISRWRPRADACYPGTLAKGGTDKTQEENEMCSILTTKNHDMFTRISTVNNKSNTGNSSSQSMYVHEDFCKAKADMCTNVDLLHFQACADGGGADLVSVLT